MDWKECNDKRFVKKVSIDINLINSLDASSNKKCKSANMLELNETTAASVISLLYDSLRELLEALAIKKGFKIYNHECFCSFLSEIVHDHQNAVLFDKFRKVRNGINYYGKDLSADNARQLKIEMTGFMKEIKKLSD